eukprot:2731844-Prymnesium_polylepis.1
MHVTDVRMRRQAGRTWSHGRGRTGRCHGDGHGSAEWHPVLTSGDVENLAGLDQLEGVLSQFVTSAGEHTIRLCSSKLAGQLLLGQHEQCAERVGQTHNDPSRGTVRAESDAHRGESERGDSERASERERAASSGESERETSELVIACDASEQKSFRARLYNRVRRSWYTAPRLVAARMGVKGLSRNVIKQVWRADTLKDLPAGTR